MKHEILIDEIIKTAKEDFTQHEYNGLTDMGKFPDSAEVQKDLGSALVEFYADEHEQEGQLDAAKIDAEVKKVLRNIELGAQEQLKVRSKNS